LWNRAVEAGEFDMLICMTGTGLAFHFFQPLKKH
jgi:hypothetical protein